MRPTQRRVVGRARSTSVTSSSSPSTSTPNKRDRSGQCLRQKRKPKEKDPEPVPESPKEREQHYIIENVVDTRIVDGYREALIKWKDYDESWNSWEPMDNIKTVALDLVQKFLDGVEMSEEEVEVERPKVAKDVAVNKLPAPDVTVNDKPLLPDVVVNDKPLVPEPDNGTTDNQPVLPLTGFDDPEKTFHSIAGMTEQNGERAFLIIFEVNGSTRPDFEVIPINVVNVKIPFEVIDFYEARVTYCG